MVRFCWVFFPSEGWLLSTCTHVDKRHWTASKAMSVSLSKSHWQTWSVVCTDGTWNGDLLAHGRKQSLVWQDYHGELLACLAVTTSSQKLVLNLLVFWFCGLFVGFSFPASHVSLLEVHSLHVLCPLWGTSRHCGPGPAPGVSLSHSLRGGFTRGGSRQKSCCHACTFAHALKGPQGS